MDTNSVAIAAVVVIVFCVLGLVAYFRFDKVKSTIDVLGIKIGITGSKEKGNKITKQGSAAAAGKPGRTEKASVKIGGKVVNSAVSAKSSNESKVDIGEDVENSNIDSN